MTTVVPFPARCDRCGSPVTGTLWSDPSVPQYACGSVPGYRRCPYLPPPDAVANVVELDRDDVERFREVVMMLNRPAGVTAVPDYTPCECPVMGPHVDPCVLR